MDKIDLGNNHLLWYESFQPDRELNPQYQDVPDVPKYGASILHMRAKDGIGSCVVFITFNGPTQRLINPSITKWIVECWEPLTIAPSILCTACGDHGFIRVGRWIPT